MSLSEQLVRSLAERLFNAGGDLERLAAVDPSPRRDALVTKVSLDRDRLIAELVAALAPASPTDSVEDAERRARAAMAAAEQRYRETMAQAPAPRASAGSLTREYVESVRQWAATGCGVISLAGIVEMCDALLAQHAADHMNGYTMSLTRERVEAIIAKLDKLQREIGVSDAAKGDGSASIGETRELCRFWLAQHAAEPARVRACPGCGRRLEPASPDWCYACDKALTSITPTIERNPVYDGDGNPVQREGAAAEARREGEA